MIKFRSDVVTSILQYLFFLTLLVSASRAETLYISGSNTLGATLIPECAKAYLLARGGENPQQITTAVNEFVIKAANVADQFVIRAHGSSTGFRAVHEGAAQMAMSSRPIKADEIALLADSGDLLAAEAEHTVAVDGLAVLVHPANPVTRLSTRQIAQVFSGEIENWSDVGGEDLPITVYARDQNSGTWDTFKGLILKKRYQLRAGVQRFESNDVLSDRVAAEPGAIGFAGLASVRNARALKVSDGDTAAVAPTHMAVATEDYPLTRRLYLYTPQALRSEQVKRFVDFCQSPPGQDVVARVGFISQNIVAVPQAPVANAPARYNELAEKAERLSVNFRFKTGSSTLDNKARRDIERLVAFLQQPDNMSRPIYLVGFSDSAKTGNSEKVLSRFRALAVWSELFSEDVLVNEALGFGAFMPLASADNDVATLKNSRVEVWISRDQRQRDAL